MFSFFCELFDFCNLAIDKFFLLRAYQVSANTLVARGKRQLDFNLRSDKVYDLFIKTFLRRHFWSNQQPDGWWSIPDSPLILSAKNWLDEYYADKQRYERVGPLDVWDAGVLFWFATKLSSVNSKPFQNPGAVRKIFKENSDVRKKLAHNRKPDDYDPYYFFEKVRSIHLDIGTLLLEAKAIPVEAHVSDRADLVSRLEDLCNYADEYQTEYPLTKDIKSSIDAKLFGFAGNINFILVTRYVVLRVFRVLEKVFVQTLTRFSFLL